MLGNCKVANCSFWIFICTGTTWDESEESLVVAGTISHFASSSRDRKSELEKKNSSEECCIYLSSIDHFVHFHDEILIESKGNARVGGVGESKSDTTTIDADDRSKR